MAGIKKTDASSQSLIEISEAKKYVELAEREISQGHTSFEVERKRMKDAKLWSEEKGAQAEARQWGIAAELLKKKEAEFKRSAKLRNTDSSSSEGKSDEPRRKTI